MRGDLHVEVIAVCTNARRPALRIGTQLLCFRGTCYVEEVGSSGVKIVCFTGEVGNVYAKKLMCVRKGMLYVEPTGSEEVTSSHTYS